MISHNLTQRVMTGLPLAGIACWYIFGANEQVFAAVSVLIGLIAYYEYGKALHFKQVPVLFLVLYLSLAIVFGGFWFYLNFKPNITYGLLVALGILLAVTSLSQSARNHKVFIWYIVPVFWILIPLCLLYLLRFKLFADRGSQLVFLIILVAAFNDIFAFFGGKRFGKRPLARIISPKKTIEGSLFGIAGGLITGLIMSSIWMIDLLPLWKSIPIIIILIVSSQAGDLVESKFKRYCGIKDSSNLIPGHGGLLDRIDAYLLALPTFIGLLYIFNVF